MRCLVDSHSFLWVLANPRRLSATARATMGDQNNELFISVASLWEISVKFGLGKLHLNGITPAELPRAAEAAEIGILAIDVADASTSYQLPRTFHKDPFDR